MSRRAVPARTNGHPFGWRWLARALALRRGTAIRLLLAIAAGYGAGLVFPVTT